MTKSRPFQEGIEKVSHTLRLDQLRLYLNLRDIQRVIIRKPLSDRLGAPDWIPRELTPIA